MKRLLHNVSSGIWGIRDMRIVLPGRALSAAGQGMAMVALVLHLHDSGAGPTATAALFASLALPTVALMGIAGRVADRHDSRRILMLGHLVEAAACATLAVVVATSGIDGALPWWACLPVAVVMQAGAAFANPVWSALVPRIVGDERIGQAIGWQQGLSTALAPIGAAASGVVYGIVGPSAALIGAAAPIALLVAAAATIRTRRHGADPSNADLNDTASSLATASSGGGLLWIRTDTLLGPLFLGLFVLVICAEGVNVVEVFLVRDALGATPQQYGFTEFCFAGGAVTGALLAGRLATTQGRLWGTIIGFAGTAATLIVAGVAPHFWVYLVAAAGIGLANSYGNAANGALIMTRIPDAARGRVASTLSGTMRVAGILALALGGIVGTWLGPRVTFIAGGSAGLVVMITVAFLATRSLRHVSQSAAAANSPAKQGVTPLTSGQPIAEQ